MANQYKNKIVYNGTILLDLSGDTVTLPEHIMAGFVGHLSDGRQVTGTGQGGGTAAISVVDTEDSRGGTIRTITALDISDTTAVAADVAQGKYFYTADGTKTAGTASGGGSSPQTATGTVTGSGTTILEIPCDFEPDIIHVYADLSGDVTLRGITKLTIIKDIALYQTQDSSSSSANESIIMIDGITGYNESSTTETHANYSNGTLTIDTVTNSAGYCFTQGITYSYKLEGSSSGGGTPSATVHMIYFEFSDDTNTTLTYYDNEGTFINSAITATIPTTYGNKTVTLAQLDGVTWYEVSGDIPLNTELVDYNAVRTGYNVNDDGTIAEGESWECVTDYIPIDPSMTFTFVSKAWYGIGFYDASKTVVRGYSANDIGTVSDDYVRGTITPSLMPSNAAYIVLTGNPYSLTSNNLSLIRTA